MFDPLKAGDETAAGPVAATATVRARDPEAAAKFTALFENYLDDAVRRGLGARFDEMTRNGEDYVGATQLDFRSAAFSVVASAIGGLGGRRGDVRVEVTDERDDGYSLAVWARSPVVDGELLVAELVISGSPATATGGWKMGVALWLSPAASRPLWDHGGAWTTGAREVVS